jgi:5-hydroxyisourate hydrolase-like protein (transthyretin family)
MVKEIREFAARAGGAAALESSRFRGVSLEKKSRRWFSHITIDNKSTYLGMFDEEDEAARVYDRMSIWCRIHGKTKKGGYKLNFDSSDYAGEEAALTAVDTKEAMVKEIRVVAARAGGAAALGMSRFRGVCLEKKSGRWMSEITIDNKSTYLGRFDKEEEAARAYDRVSIWCKIHGKTKHGGYVLNFDSSDYAGEEAALTAIDTMEAMVKKIREDAARACCATASASSTFRGVSLEKKSGRWVSQITIDNKNTRLGTFDEEDEAARAYDRFSIWCKTHGTIKTGSFKLNFDSNNYADEEEELRVCTQADLIKRLKLGKAVSVEEGESVGSGETKRGQKRKQPPHSEDDDNNAADDGHEEADDGSRDAYLADDDKEKEEDKEEVEKEGDNVENEDGSDTSGGSDTGGGGHNLAAELSTVDHIHVATVTVAKGTATIGAKIVTIADQENVTLRANNNVELGDALYSAQAQAAASIAVKHHNGISIISIDGGGDDGVLGGGHIGLDEWSWHL